MKRILVFACVFSLLTGVASALVKPASVFGSHMVLQRQMPIPVWGEGAPGEKVTVSFGGQSVSATVDGVGVWKVHLAPMEANAAAQTLEITSSSGSAFAFEDVLVGEVWLCSGQSNMEMPLWTDRPRWRNIDGDKYAAEGGNPLIRIARMTPYKWLPLPNANFPMSWSELTPQNALGFSAVAFFFGHRLQRELGVPIGLVTSHWGGTRIEPWTPPCGFDSVPELADTAHWVNARLPGHPEYLALIDRTRALVSAWQASFEQAAEAGKPLPEAPVFPEEMARMNSHQQPTALYNSMIYPLVPLAIRGAIWYQGCSNLADGPLYRYKMQALFNGWKRIFENPELKFYFVQLAPCGYSGDKLALPVIWEAQEQFCKDNEPQVGMAVINDVGDYYDIHPHNKKPVGERLANLALNRTYGRADLKPDFPRPASCTFDGASCTLTFDNVKEWKCTEPSGRPSPKDFEVAGIDSVFVNPETVEMDGTSLKVTLPGGGKLFHVRYLWLQTVTSTLFNENGLPMGAFRFSAPVAEEDFKKVIGNQTLVFKIDLCQTGIQRGAPARYLVDNSKDVQGKIKRVTYFLRARGRTGDIQWMIVGMDAFSQEAAKLGIPTAASGASFQAKVSNLSVVTNVPSVASKTYPEGSIEFFPNNYNPPPKLKLPGNVNGKYDFDDTPATPLDGYGSMQVHAFADKLTLFAFNNFCAGAEADFGFGNSTGQHPDWTFSRNLRAFESVMLEVYVTLD